MKAMAPKRLRVLIIGIGFSIFGPIVGWVLSLLGLFHTVRKSNDALMETARRGDFGALLQDTQTTGDNAFLSMVPLLVGAVLGATGLFLIALALVKHFLQGEPATEPAVRAYEWPEDGVKAVPSPAAQDDSRYMPKG